MASNIPEEVQALLDKQAITEVVMRYARGYDRLDLATLEGVYWEDAEEDFGMRKQGGRVKEFLEFREQMDEQFISQQHHISNILIDLHGDLAKGESSYIYHALFHSPNGDMELLMGGRYIDQFEKRNGEWRILKRVRLADWNKTSLSESNWNASLTMGADRGAKFPDDKFYSLYSA